MSVKAEHSRNQKFGVEVFTMKLIRNYKEIDQEELQPQVQLQLSD